MGSAVYYVAEQVLENEEQKVVIKEEVSQQEMQRFFQVFEFLGDISPAEIAYEIAIRNGHEFSSYMKRDNLAHLSLVDKVPDRALVAEANRLVFNLCVSVKTFIDYSKKALNKRKDAKKTFEEYISQVFDSKDDLSYRFFDKLRNFCVHYSFPFSKVVAKMPGTIELLCEKSHLQQYDGWGAIVSKDLFKMPECICIPDYVETLLVAITSIDLMLYYSFVKDYYKANYEVAKLMTKHNLKSPIFVSKDEHQNVSLHPIPISPIVRGIGKLKKHPNVTVNIVTVGEGQEIQICHPEVP